MATDSANSCPPVGKRTAQGTTCITAITTIKKRIALAAAVLLSPGMHASAVDAPLCTEGHVVKGNGKPVFRMGDTKWTIGARGWGAVRVPRNSKQ